MKNVTPRPPRHRSPLLTGVLLIAAGLALMLINLGFGIPRLVWDYWPFALMALGLAGLILPSRHLTRSGGAWLLALGAYCQISIVGLFGLSWSSAWPIFIIAMGVSTILHDCGRGDDDKVLHET